MTFNIHVYGVDHTVLNDREKEELAMQLHDILQEDFDIHPDSVGVEGYLENDE